MKLTKIHVMGQPLSDVMIEDIKGAPNVSIYVVPGESMRVINVGSFQEGLELTSETLYAMLPALVKAATIMEGNGG